MTDNLSTAQLGVEAELFKSSGLGRHLNYRAESEIIDASQELCTVDPTDTKAITELQNKVYRANSFITWINEAIEEGDYALNEIRSNEHD